MKLSIIIPVYNVEKYVEKCIRSCENQDIPKEDYEVIVVNDGSPDGSLAIVERVAKEYPNIKVISQENQGLSGARNTGLAAAQGEYVWFVDSDDWIEEDCLKGLTEKLVDDIDILQIQYKNAYEDGTTKIPAQKFLDGIYSGKEITEQGGLADPAQFSVLRSKFLKDNNFKFFPGIYHEDSELRHRMVYTAKKIAFNNTPIYYYLQRTTGSIMAVPKPKRSYDEIIVCRHIHDFQNDNVEGVKANEHFNYMISMYLNNALYNICRTTKEDKAKFNIEMWKNRDLFLHLKDAKLLKYKLEYFLFKLFPKNTVEVYRLLQLGNKS